MDVCRAYLIYANKMYDIFYLHFKHRNYLHLISIRSKLAQLNLHIIMSANADSGKFISNCEYFV